MGIKDIADVSSGAGRVRTAGTRAILNRMRNGGKGEF